MSNCVFWIILACSTLCHAAPAPSYDMKALARTPVNLKTLHAKRDHFAMMTLPSEHDLDSADDIRLLPVSEIFKMMTANSETASPTTLPSVDAPTPLSSPPSTTSADILMTEIPTTTRRTAGPSLAVISGPESTPPSNTADQSVHDHPHPAPVDKLIVIGCVLGGMIVLSLLVFLTFNFLVSSVCKREKKIVLSNSKLSPFYKANKEDELDMSTDSVNNSTWPKFPPPSATYRQKEKQAGSLGPPTHRVLSKVMDITPGFPRSKFSMTISDYTHSPRSSVNSSVVSMPPIPIVGQVPSAAPALLSPSEFFSLSSSSDLRRSLSSGHSRIHSAPIFGHNFTSRALLASTFNKMRAGDHRKSKSISGLVYAVGRLSSVSTYSHRKSTSSKFSHYKGTPPTDGLLSAPNP